MSTTTPPPGGGPGPAIAANTAAINRLADALRENQAHTRKMATGFAGWNQVFDEGINLVKEIISSGDRWLQIAGGLGENFDNLTDEMGTFGKDLGGSFANMDAQMEILQRGLGINNKSLRETLVRAKLTGQNEKTIISLTENLIRVTGMSVIKAGDMVKSLADNALANRRNLSVLEGLQESLTALTEDFGKFGEDAGPLRESLVDVVRILPQANFKDAGKFVQLLVTSLEKGTLPTGLVKLGYQIDQATLAGQKTSDLIIAAIFEAERRADQAARNTMGAYRAIRTQIADVMLGEVGVLGKRLAEAIRNNSDHLMRRQDAEKGLLEANKSLKATWIEFQGMLAEDIIPALRDVVNGVKWVVEGIKTITDSSLWTALAAVGGFILSFTPLLGPLIAYAAAIVGVIYVVRNFNKAVEALKMIWNATLGKVFGTIQLAKIESESEKQTKLLASIDKKTEEPKIKAYRPSDSLAAVNAVFDRAFGVSRAKEPSDPVTRGELNSTLMEIHKDLLRIEGYSKKRKR